MFLFIIKLDYMVLLMLVQQYTDLLVVKGLTNIYIYSNKYSLIYVRDNLYKGLTLYEDQPFVKTSFYFPRVVLIHKFP